jgi:hypothetical protein
MQKKNMPTCAKHKICPNEQSNYLDNIKAMCGKYVKNMKNMQIICRI